MKMAKKKADSLLHKRDILLQVNEKERERINKQKEKMEEGLAIRAEQEMRTRCIRQALVSKMNKLRYYSYKIFRQRIIVSHLFQEKQRPGECRERHRTPNKRSLRHALIIFLQDFFFWFLKELLNVTIRN